jgi:hypothetical protein
MRERYARWARRQAGQCNCGHAAGFGVIAAGVAVFAVAEVIIRYHVVIEQALAVIAGGAVVGVITWGLRRRRPQVPRADALMCGRGCGRPARGEVTWANGVRSTTEVLCGACYDATVVADRAALAAAAVPPPPAVLAAGPVTADAPAPAGAGSLVAAAWDNQAPSGALPAEITGLDVAWPGAGWTRGHP